MIQRSLLLALGWMVIVAMLPGKPSVGQPNIIFMLTDDQGWNGLSVAMHPEIASSKGEAFHTPNLEKLARQGMRFSSAYAPAPVCSPTRISIQTEKVRHSSTGQKLHHPSLVANLLNLD